MRRILRLFVTIGWIYLGLVAVIAALQRQFLFFPTREPERVMLADAATLELEPWRNAAGEIIGWTRQPEPGVLAAHKLVVFHGNAGHALHRADYARAFEALDRGRSWQVWLFEYPGYGARAGSPSQDAFAQAARSAVAELRARDSRPVYLLGESLGAGVAADLAAESSNDIAGLVLITPWARLIDVARRHYPFLPVRLILRDRWDNVATLAAFRKPTAVLVAGRDEIVGAAQSDTLFETLAGPKWRWLFPDAMHNDAEIQSAGWAGEVSGFLLDPAHAKR